MVLKISQALFSSAEDFFLCPSLTLQIHYTELPVQKTRQPCVKIFTSGGLVPLNFWEKKIGKKLS